VAWWPGGLVGNNIATCVVNVSLQPCKNLPRCSFAWLLLSPPDGNTQLSTPL